MNDRRVARDAGGSRGSQAGERSVKRVARRRSALAWLTALCVLGLFVALTFRATFSQGLSVGDPVDDLGLLTLDGEPAPLLQWRGHGIMMRLSSTACATCPNDFPLLEQWQRELGDEVKVIAVQVGESADAVRTALMGQEPAVPVLLDPSGEAARRLGLKQVPAVYFFTARGTLSSVSNVDVSRTDVAAHVRMLLLGGPDIEAVVRDVSRLLQCPECEGRSVWESDTRSSFAVRERVRELLLAGRRPDEVLELIAEEYGEWVLLAPPARGFASLVWALPVAGLVVGIGLWAAFVARARSRGSANPRASHGSTDARGRSSDAADAASAAGAPGAAEEGGVASPDAPPHAGVEAKRQRLARRIDEYM